MTSEIVRERSKNPAILSEILSTVRRLHRKGKEPTFNAILNELSAKRVLKFHRTLRKYLDLLVSARLLAVKREKTIQRNIREKQVYLMVSGHNQPIVEAGEKALLLHGLNWDVPSPVSVSAKTDLKGLALATVSGCIAYASLEDSLVQSLKVLPRRHPRRASEIFVFATALLATRKVDFDYLIKRARGEGVEREILSILLRIDKTLASANPGVEDIRTLFELRENYSHLRKPLLRAIQGAQSRVSRITQTKIVSPNEVIEYAGKQLGIRG